jgi:hypothetical protein
MRHLTASQKIAVLENRVAQLEKQAMLDSLKAKVNEAMQPFKRLVPETKKIIKKTRESPKQIAKKYMKIRKDPNFKKATKQIQREVGSSPVKQVSYIIDAYKSGAFEPTPRTASMRRKSSRRLVSGERLFDDYIIPGLVFVATWSSAPFYALFFIIEFCLLWVLSKIKGLFKSSSMNKEAFPTTGLLLILIIIWLLDD